MVKTLAAAAATLVALIVSAGSAFACGGLVAPDGDVRLQKATTFVAWSAGVEHYITSFAYEGSAADVGWIVPLPAVPDSITPAGRWTLQRLEREVLPPRPLVFGALAAAGAKDAAVLERVQVEALDVTILKGSGQGVVGWCAHNGFALNQETRDHLVRYARGSPIFMAAKYNTSIAQQRRLAQGDGVPLMIRVRTPRLWVPLEVLANDDTNVDADIFLLTADRPFTATALSNWPYLSSFASNSVDGAQGFVVAKQEPMNDALYTDLSSDRNMGWVPRTGWLSYLTLSAPSEQVTYDLSLGSDDLIRLEAFGSKPDSPPPPAAAPALVPVTLIAAGAATLVAVLLAALRRRTRGSQPAA
jgi:Uncharacterized protein conserved in bacteria (DUF2330)